MIHQPNARQVIGVAINQHFISGVLTDLNGAIMLHHVAAVDSTALRDVFELMVEVVNGLFAQLSAPLLCLSVGVSGVVDEQLGLVHHAPRLGWRDAPMADMLRQHYDTTIYVSNSYALAALGQYTFQTARWTRPLTDIATIQIGGSVGVGIVQRGGVSYTGGEIGSLTHAPETTPRYEERLGWASVVSRTRMLASTHRSEHLSAHEINYAVIRYATAMNDPAALILLDELSGHVAEIFAWVIALTHPQGISLTGAIANLGTPFLDHVREKTTLRLLPDHLYGIEFRIDKTRYLPALGAAARGIRHQRETS